MARFPANVRELAGTMRALVGPAAGPCPILAGSLMVSAAELDNVDRALTEVREAQAEKQCPPASRPRNP